MSELEDKFEEQLIEAGIDGYVRQLRFYGRAGQTRRFKFDFAWPDRLLVVEIDGGSFVGGRHTTGIGFSKDCEKMNLAVLEQWRILRLDTVMVKDGRGIEWLKEAMELFPPIVEETAA